MTSEAALDAAQKLFDEWSLMYWPSAYGGGEPLWDDLVQRIADLLLKDRDGIIRES